MKHRSHFGLVKDQNLEAGEPSFSAEASTVCYKGNRAENSQWPVLPGGGADGSPFHLPKFISLLGTGSQPMS